MVLWIKQSLKKLNEKKSEEQARDEEIAEIRDALVEIADIIVDISADISTLALDSSEGGGNYG